MGAIVEGVPPRMALTEADIQVQLSRRRPGQSDLTTPRNEADAVEIYSGTEVGVMQSLSRCSVIKRMVTYESLPNSHSIDNPSHL